MHQGQDGRCGRPSRRLCYLGRPVGLGHLPGGGDGVSEDFSVVRDPWTTDAVCRLQENKAAVSFYVL